VLGAPFVAWPLISDHPAAAFGLSNADAVEALEALNLPALDD